MGKRKELTLVPCLAPSACLELCSPDLRGEKKPGNTEYMSACLERFVVVSWEGHNWIPIIVEVKSSVNSPGSGCWRNDSHSV